MLRKLADEEQRSAISRVPLNEAKSSQLIQSRIYITIFVGKELGFDLERSIFENTTRVSEHGET